MLHHISLNSKNKNQNKYNLYKTKFFAMFPFFFFVLSYTLEGYGPMAYEYWVLFPSYEDLHFKSFTYHFSFYEFG